MRPLRASRSLPGEVALPLLVLGVGAVAIAIVRVARGAPGWRSSSSSSSSGDWSSSSSSSFGSSSSSSSSDSGFSGGGGDSGGGGASDSY